MKRYYYIICMLTMLIADTIIAQSPAEWSVQFNIAATLPPAAGKQMTLGFAGAVSGVHQNHLLVAGGANFPEALPWKGGKKIYYAGVYLYKQEKGELKLVQQGITLPESIAYAAVCTTSDGIVYMGGENEKGISNKVWDAEVESIQTRTGLHCISTITYCFNQCCSNLYQQSNFCCWRRNQ
jgi:N-acetylneuraminate epimerase